MEIHLWLSFYFPVHRITLENGSTLVPKEKILFSQRRHLIIREAKTVLTELLVYPLPINSLAMSAYYLWYLTNEVTLVWSKETLDNCLWGGSFLKIWLKMDYLVNYMYLLSKEKMIRLVCLQKKFNFLPDFRCAWGIGGAGGSGRDGFILSQLKSWPLR